ncbi:MAG: T9SS type A sorting domain-containing protein [Bacteroidetes bacterium]|nr:MAG: T9SS type A sorting domain-containing protein [Bacteroidota bacterium]
MVVNPIPAQPIVSQNGNTLSVVLQAGESAEWFYAGSSVGVGASITITTSGTYEVIVTNSYGCQSNTISTYNVSEASISELSSLTSIEVYPNPTNGKFNVALSAKQNFEIYLTDLIGRQLSPSVVLNTGEHVVPFDVSDYSKGVYLIVIKTDNESFSTRILIQ